MNNRDNKTRIVSARKATSKEISRHYENISSRIYGPADVADVFYM